MYLFIYVYSNFCWYRYLHWPIRICHGYYGTSPSTVPMQMKLLWKHCKHVQMENKVLQAERRLSESGQSHVNVRLISALMVLNSSCKALCLLIIFCQLYWGRFRFYLILVERREEAPTPNDCCNVLHVQGRLRSWKELEMFHQSSSYCEFRTHPHRWTKHAESIAFELLKFNRRK